jgi:hypothetical protein
MSVLVGLFRGFLSPGRNLHRLQAKVLESALSSAFVSQMYLGINVCEYVAHILFHRFVDFSKN